MAIKKETPEAGKRPVFMEWLSSVYSDRRRNVILLSGDVEGPFWDRATQQFVPLEQLLNSELSPKFHLLRMDIGEGVTFCNEATRREVVRICESPDGIRVPKGRAVAFERFIDDTIHQPLVAIRALHTITEAFGRVRKKGTLKPLCVIMEYAGALFPAGDFGKLSELDRQRLVLFLNWIISPTIIDGDDLILLIAETRAEVNEKILLRSNTAHVEIQLPSREERAHLVNAFTKTHKGIRFRGSAEGREAFIGDTAGLSLANLLDILEVSRNTRQLITREHVLAEVNTILQARLGDIIRINRPQHGPRDIIGYQEAGIILTGVFERCEDPETAVSAILVSGPNGAGKTFQLEAHASQSGRIVIELAGIRGSYFGETDKFFEMLRWHIQTFGKVLVLVDEAHTAFGSVHASDVHPTERRLAGNIIKMMGDRRFLGKMLWALMTSRPDELDPDVKSRSPIQIPIFDLEGDERRAFVSALFERKRIKLAESALSEVIAKTEHYSARDYSFLVAEVLARRSRDKKIRVGAVLSTWQASSAIREQREFQALVAAEHCSYPHLLPEYIGALSERERADRIEELKRRLKL